MTVSVLPGITHACFGLSYLVALALEVVQQMRPSRGLRIASLIAGAAGFVAHTAYIAYHHPSPATPYGSFLLLAWVLAFFYLRGAIHHSRQAWGVFVLPLVIALVGLSLALLRGGESAVDVPSWVSGARFWGAVHGTLILLAAVGISVGFLASIMYLVQSHRMRNKVNPTQVVPMLSMERLEKMSRNAVNWAFPLLTAGLLVGLLLLPSESDPSASWLSLKVLSTAGLWVVFLVLVYLRYATNVPGRRLAALSIAAFALLLVALIASHPFVVGAAR